MSFDGEACIRLIRDRSTGEADLVGAIESLMYYPTPQSCDVLFEVVMDTTREEHIREEAAGSLGSLWIEMGVDYALLRIIPTQFVSEMASDFRLAGISIKDLDVVEDCE